MSKNSSFENNVETLYQGYDEDYTVALFKTLPRYSGYAGNYETSVDRLPEGGSKIQFIMDGGYVEFLPFFEKIMSLDIDGVNVDTQQFQVSFESQAAMVLCAKAYGDKFIVANTQGFTEAMEKILKQYAHVESIKDMDAKFPYKHPDSVSAICNGFYEVIDFSLPVLKEQYGANTKIEIDLCESQGITKFMLKCEGVDTAEDTERALQNMYNEFEAESKAMTLAVNLRQQDDGHWAIVLCGSNMQEFVELLDACYENRQIKNAVHADIEVIRETVSNELEQGKNVGNANNVLAFPSSIKPVLQ